MIGAAYSTQWNDSQEATEISPFAKANTSAYYKQRSNDTALLHFCLPSLMQCLSVVKLKAGPCWVQGSVVPRHLDPLPKREPAADKNDCLLKIYMYIHTHIHIYFYI